MERSQGRGRILGLVLVGGRGGGEGVGGRTTTCRESCGDSEHELQPSNMVSFSPLRGGTTNVLRLTELNR